MPDEPNGKIEELLKAYARKRREDVGAPLELHPATRKLLQSEVARLRPEPESEAPGNLWSMIWPRMGWVLSILAVLALAAWLLMPALAPARRSAKMQSELSWARANESEPSSVLRQLSEQAASDKLSEKLDRAEQAPATVPAAPMPALAANAPTLSYRTSPSLAQDDRKEHDGLDLAKVKDRDAGAAGNKLSLRDSPELPGVAVNSQPQAFFSQEGVNTGDSFSFAPQAAAPLMEQRQTNPALFAAVPPRRYSAVPSTSLPSESASPEQADLYLGQNRMDAKGRTTLNNETQAGVAGAYAAAQASASAASRGRIDDDLSVTGRQRFRQLESETEPDRQAGSGNTATILQTFDLEQEGDRIRILDADGSIYEGRVAWTQTSRMKDPAGLTAGAELRREQKKVEPLKTAAAAKEGTGATAQTISLRASGTNRLLNQLVVIDCTLGPAVDAGVTLGLPGGGGRGADSAKPAQTAGKSTAAVPQSASTRMQQGMRMQGQSPALRLTRFQGVARIGPTNQIQIDAIQVAP